jgi:hypothetical protein
VSSHCQDSKTVSSQCQDIIYEGEYFFQNSCHKRKSPFFSVIEVTTNTVTVHLAHLSVRLEAWKTLWT